MTKAEAQKVAAAVSGTLRGKDEATVEALAGALTQAFPRYPWLKMLRMAS